MSRMLDSLLADALRLDAAERAELAIELIASLDGPVDDDVTAAWNAELERRMASIDAGTATFESWDDVKRRLRSEISGS